MPSPSDYCAPWVLEQLRRLAERCTAEASEPVVLELLESYVSRGAAGREVSAAEMSLLNHLVVTGEVDASLLERVRHQRAERCTVEVQEPVVLYQRPGGDTEGPYWRGNPAYFYWCPDCGFTVQIGVDGACGECIKHKGCNTLAFLYSVVDVVVDFMVAVGK